MENLFNYLKYKYNGEFDGYGATVIRKIYSFKITPASSTAIYTLPKWLEPYVNDAEFALPDYAYDTIQHLFEEAIKYTQEPLFRGYDTSMREMLLGISHTIIEKAILLLTDYYYDKNTLYYVNQATTLISRHTLAKLILYQLWSGRTGRGLQLRYSKLNYDEQYNGDTYFQNDFWLKQLLENEEKIQEDAILHTQNVLIDRDDEDLIYEVEAIDNTPEVSCSRYDATFMYYRHHKSIKSNDSVYDNEFENEFENDIPERTLIKYKITHYNKSAALRLALNRFAYDAFDTIHRFDINPIYKFTYDIELIKEHIKGCGTTIDVLKS